MPLSSENAKRAGRLGGLATKKKMLELNPNYYQDIGMRGYKAATKSQGKKHMIAGGKKSGEVRKARLEANAK